MGPYLSQPIVQKKIKQIDHGKHLVQTCQMQGWRRQMQDALMAIQIVPDSTYIYGVFDGHGGPEVSHYVSKIFHKQLLNEPHFKLKNYTKALTNTFKRMDDLLLSNRGEEQLQRIQKQLSLNPSLQKQTISFRTGCTANVTLITKQKIYVANAGDSRCVLCRKGRAIALSEDHKPENPLQKNRVLKAGGQVSNGRINGGLNLSRSLGDFAFKSVPKLAYNQQPIICVPQVLQIERKQEQDEFIIMGCDGIWQKYISNNQQMINFVKKLQLKHPNHQEMFQEMFNTFLGKNTEEENGCDNMSAIIIHFK